MNLHDLARRNQFSRVHPPGYSPAISALDLEHLRKVGYSAFDKWMVVIRPVPGSWGQTTEVQTVRVGRYPYHIDERQAETEINPDGRAASESVVYYNLATMPDADIDAADRIGAPGWFENWAPETVYPVGRVIRGVTSGVGSSPLMRCIRAGASGEVEPVWSRIIGTVIEEEPGAVAVWKVTEIASYYEVVSRDINLSNQTRLILKVKELS